MDIAYQVLGDGPADLLMFPGPFVPIDSIDDEPSLYRFHRRLASFCRVIRFDHRGVGLSSRMLSMDTLGPQYWAEDAITVMDAWWDLAGDRAGPPTMARAVSKAVAESDVRAAP